MSLGIGRQVIGIEMRDGVFRAVLCHRVWNRVRTVDSLTIPQIDALPPESFAAKFREWRASHAAGSAWIAVILPRDAMVCRIITLPLAADSELKSVVGLQIEFLHPYENEEVFWDCSALTSADSKASSATGRGEAALRKVAARVVVARRSAAEEMLRWLRERGIAATQLTAAVEAARGAILPDAEQAAQTVLCLSEGAHVELIAAAPAVDGAAQSCSLLCDAEQPPAAAAAQIAKGLDTLRATRAGSAANSRVLVWGSLPESGDYWNVVRAELSQEYAVTELRPEALAEAAARTALASEPARSFNLLPVSERHYEPTANLIPTYALAGLVIVLAGLLGVRGTVADLRQDRRLEGELETLKPQVAAISAKQDQMTRTHERVVFLKSVREGARVPLDVMEEIAQRLPNEAWLQQLQMDGQAATLSGSAASASEVLQAFSGATHLESAQFLSAILRSNEGRESFRIGLRLRQPLR